MKINITRRHLEVYITESSRRSQQSHKEYTIYGDTLVLVKDPLPEYINLSACLKRIEKIVPYHLIYGLDSVFIGKFPEFEKRQINAFYRDGAIYITNEQDDEEDFIDDMVHEFAHLVANNYGSEIFENNTLVREFLGKRQRLFFLLKGEGYDVNPGDFTNIEYSYEFDMFLFKEVGYEVLSQITAGLFVTPYSATSVAEYFAEGFETYYLRNRSELKGVSPVCYQKIFSLDEKGE